MPEQNGILVRRPVATLSSAAAIVIAVMIANNAWNASQYADKDRVSSIETQIAVLERDVGSNESVITEIKAELRKIEDQLGVVVKALARIEGAISKGAAQ